MKTITILLTLLSLTTTTAQTSYIFDVEATAIVGSEKYTKDQMIWFGNSKDTLYLFMFDCYKSLSCMREKLVTKQFLWLRLIETDKSRTKAVMSGLQDPHELIFNKVTHSGRIDEQWVYENAYGELVGVRVIKDATKDTYTFSMWLTNLDRKGYAWYLCHNCK